MTLIVGIKCTDGVVLASDGAISGTVAQQTRKLAIIDSCGVIGSSGPVGLSQRFAGTLGYYCKDPTYRDKDSFVVMTEISQVMRQHIQIESNMADQLKNLQPGVNKLWMSAILVSLPVKGKARLFSFDHFGAPLEATDSLPFASIGSGNYLAQPFLAFIKRVVWEDRVPNLGAGIFAAVWSLDHAIVTNPTGVSQPVQVVILREENGIYRARELSQHELGEHREAIESVESSIASAVSDLDVKTSPPPTPPAGTAPVE